MKRILVSILAFLYLSTSMGATIHLHYCMGKLVSWGLIDHKSKNCDTCGMEKKGSAKDSLSSINHCCKDVHKEIRANKDQKIPQSEFQFLQLLLDAVFIQEKAPHDFRLPADYLRVPPTHAPPYLASQDVFLLNRNFRI